MKKLLAKITALASALIFSFFCNATESQKSKPIATIIQEPGTNKITTQKIRKNWNFIVYLAANNNLHRFAIQNIAQMKQVGSTNSMNAIIQIDKLGAQEISRYYVQKGSIDQVFNDKNNSACVSGTQESLYNFIVWTLQNYPADHNCLVLWNHGSGIKDPSMWQRVLSGNRNELFVFNPDKGLYEINRKLKRQEYIDPERGIGFNDAFEEYLTNQDLQIVLERVSKEHLNGGKIDIVCMDACLMQMAEVGSQIKNAVKYMVGSEEVSRGEGYPYEKILAPFTNGTLTPECFAKHVTQSYAKFYTPIDADYTQSTINLDLMPELEENFGQITKILMDLISSANGQACMNIIRTIRNDTNKTIEFYDPDYIDLGKFYTSMYQAFSNSRDFDKTQSTVNALKEKLAQGLASIKKTIVEKAAGRNWPDASGISFYFPATTIHKSYPKTIFDQTTKWSSFLARYHKKRTIIIDAPYDR